MIRIRREPYTKYESVKEEPGGDEAEGEVYRDCEMPSAWPAIFDPDRIHWRLQTSNSGGSMERIHRLLKFAQEQTHSFV